VRGAAPGTFAYAPLTSSYVLTGAAPTGYTYGAPFVTSAVKFNPAGTTNGGNAAGKE